MVNAFLFFFSSSAASCLGPCPPQLSKKRDSLGPWSYIARVNRRLNSQQHRAHFFSRWLDEPEEIREYSLTAKPLAGLAGERFPFDRRVRFAYKSGPAVLPQCWNFFFHPHPAGQDPSPWSHNRGRQVNAGRGLAGYRCLPGRSAAAFQSAISTARNKNNPRRVTQDVAGAAANRHSWPQRIPRCWFNDKRSTTNISPTGAPRPTPRRNSWLPPRPRTDSPRFHIRQPLPRAYETASAEPAPPELVRRLRNSASAIAPHTWLKRIPAAGDPVFRRGHHRGRSTHANPKRSIKARKPATYIAPRSAPTGPDHPRHRPVDKSCTPRRETS